MKIEIVRFLGVLCPMRNHEFVKFTSCTECIHNDVIDTNMTYVSCRYDKTEVGD